MLKPGGWFLYVVPGARHLWELKQVLYDRPYPNEEKQTPYPGFAYRAIREVDFTAHLPDPQTIQDLFQMTPYFWKTPKQGAALAGRPAQLGHHRLLPGPCVPEGRGRGGHAMGPLPLCSLWTLSLTRVFAGNPAAVCLLERRLPEALMQRVARRRTTSPRPLSLHENRRRSMRLRWFTPAGEIDLCGHATLAAAHVVLTHAEPGPAAGHASHTLQRPPPRPEAAGDLYEMDFPAYDPAPPSR